MRRVLDVISKLQELDSDPMYALGVLQGHVMKSMDDELSNQQSNTVEKLMDYMEGVVGGNESVELSPKDYAGAVYTPFSKKEE